MRNKNLKALAGAMVISIIGLSTVYGSGWSTYSTSYDMTGGIYTKKTFDVDTKMKISISPDIGRSDCNMSIYTYTEHWYGKTRDNCIADVSSISSSTTVSTYTGKYGIYLRNWSGFQWTGDLTINYK